MKPVNRNRQQGFLIIMVVLILGVLAALGLMLSNSTALDITLVGKKTESSTLEYLAESALEHVKWQLTQNTTCSAYQNIPTTPFGRGTYAATVTPTINSPVAIAATGSLADGTMRTLTLEGVQVYDHATPMTALLMPGVEGKDTFIEGESGHTDHNKGGNTELKTRSKTNKEYRVLLEFDFSSLPATALIQTATLTLESKGAGTAEIVDAHAMLRSWTEGGATWETYDGSNAWSTPGGDYDATIAGSFLAGTTGPKSMDITDLAKAWVNGSSPNYGLVLLSPMTPSGDAMEFHSSDAGGALHPSLQLTYVCECGAVCTGIASGNSLVLSTDSPATLAGLSFDDIDVANYDPSLGMASLLLEGALTSLSKDIDAVHVLDNGHIVLSTKDAANLGGLSFGEEDLVEYDVSADAATMYFDGSNHFDEDENIISVHILNNGNLVLSTASDANLGGLDFSNRDLVEYNPTTSAASIFFDGDATTLSEEITAVHVLENGHLVLGVNDDTTLGGLSFTAADLIQYDPTADTASLYFNGSVLFADSNERVVSAHINGDSGPPVTAALKVLFVVPFPGSLTSEDDQRRTLMESWGYTVNLIDDSDSQANYDSAAASNDVVYVGEEIVSTEIGNKLRDLPIGVVSEEQQLRDELGFASSHDADDSMRDIDIVDVTHDITVGFPAGDLSITSNDQRMLYLLGTLSPDLQVLAYYPFSSYPNLAVLNAGDTLYGGGNAAGRRVWLPWGGNTFEFAALNADGLTIMQRAIEWAADSATAFGPLAHWKLDDGAGIAAIDSISGHTGTLVNGPLWADPGKVDGALYFDGINDYIDVSSMNPVSYDDFTISAWYMSADTTVSDDEYIYVHAEGFITNGVSFGATDDGSDDDKLRLTIDVNDVTDRHYGSSDIIDQQWHHLVAIRSGGRIKLYVDNVEESDEPDAFAGLTLTVDGDGPFVGDLPGGTEQVHGTLDDVRLYDRALSAVEIADLYMTGGGGGGGGSPSGSLRDEFNTNASFAGDDGTLSWSTDWLEIGESDGAGSGDVRTQNDAGPYQLRIRDNNNGGEGVEREADLSACAGATLSFDYRRESLDNSNDYVTIDVSSNGGSSWTELDRLQGSATDSAYQSANYDISAHKAASTRIRFLGSATLGNTDTVYFDNVEILCP